MMLHRIMWGCYVLSTIKYHVNDNDPLYQQFNKTPFLLLKRLTTYRKSTSQQSAHGSVA